MKRRPGTSMFPRRAPATALGRMAALGAVVAALALSTGCASSAARPSGDVRGAQAPDHALAREAERQKSRPVRAVMAAPAPPGVDGALLEPIDPENERARASLDAVVDTLLANEPSTAGVAGEAAPAEGERSAEAIRLYISARSKRLAADAAGAIRDLQALVRLDPRAAEPWRELGEAHLLKGDRISAVASFQEALRRDPDDLRSLIQVGLALLERRNYEGAAATLSKAWRSGAGAAPATRHVVALALGRALLELGHVQAGAEALAVAVDLPEHYDQPTIYLQEIAEVYRDRGDIWRQIGDASSRLGRFEDALAAYDQATRLPTFDPGAVAPRRVNAAMRLGRPALAAQVVAAEIMAARGSVEDRHLRLIEYLARHTETGPALAAAIERIGAGLDDDSRRISASRMARARAAALPPGEAIGALRARLAAAPADESALQDLFHRLDATSPAELLGETIGLITRAPLEERRYAHALLRVQPSARELLDAWPALPERAASSPAGALLRSRLLLATGDADAAERALRELVDSNPAFAPGLVTLARHLAEHDRDHEAGELLQAIDESADRELRYAEALVLQAMSEPERALAALRPLLESDAGDVAQRAVEALRAAELSVALRRWSDAERWCLRALQLDPTMEDAHGALIGLYAPASPLADQGKLADAVRRLRESIPSSRTLRWLRAQDLARTGQLDQAERELLSLAEDEPSRPVVDLLVTLWLRTNSADRAIEWLEQKAVQRPTDPTPRLELARVLAHEDKAEKAVEILREWLAVRPTDASALRQLEQVLREKLGRGAEADAMALRRLDRPNLGLGEALELAAVLYRRGDEEGAIAAVERVAGATPPPTPTDEEANELARFVFQIGERGEASGVEALGALPLFDAALRILPHMPIALHNQRVTLMVRAKVDADSIMQAVAIGAAQHPALAADLHLQTVVLLARDERPGDALRVLEQGAAGAPADEERFWSPWLQLAAIALDRASVERLVRAVDKAGKVGLLIENPPPGPGKAAGALAFSFAQHFASAGLEDDADALYRVALEFDRAHPMANNNLGYRLLERGERFEEAMRLLEAAYAAEPDDDNIVDSIGWARYKLEHFDDERTPDGEIEREGAVTLLRRAAELATAREREAADRAAPQAEIRALARGRAIILDHLGDALWRIGDSEGAAAQWRVAQDVVAQLQRRLGQRDDAEVGALAASIKAKLAATAEGDRPAVSPLAREIRAANASSPPAVHEAGAATTGGASF